MHGDQLQPAGSGSVDGDDNSDGGQAVNHALIRYAKYRRADGVILGFTLLASSVQPTESEAIGFIPLAADEPIEVGAHKVAIAGHDTVIVAKDPVPGVPARIEIAADGLDEARITGLPVAGLSVAYRDGNWPESFPEVEAVEDGVFELSSDTPGRFVVEFRSDLHLPAITEIIAT